MKKLCFVMALAVLLVGLTACAASPAADSSLLTETSAAGAPQPAESTDTENADAESTGETPAADADAPGASESAGGKDPGETVGAPRVLIAYFSATGNTESVAGHMQAALGENADLFAILPETPYTDADLNYNDPDSRSTQEMNDPDARPAIAADCAVADMAAYDVVFVGYPIWWGEAPRIVCTFLEAYDLSGKTVVPFCTSASSGMGASAARLQELTDGADWLEGRRFGGNASAEDVAEWVDSLQLAGTAQRT